jgi:hypothetical protein
VVGRGEKGCGRSQRLVVFATTTPASIRFAVLFRTVILRETESLRIAKRVDDPGMMVFSHRRGQCKRHLLKWGKNRIIVAQHGNIGKGCSKGKERDLVMT